MARRLIFIIWLALCQSNAAAQTRATMAGTVTDQNGALVANAEVRLLNIASGRSLGTRTDDSGRYSLTDLPPGSYQLSVSREGFATAARRVILDNDAPLTEDFLLVPGIIKSTITVTAGKGSARIVAETPQSITVTDTLQIEERRPASTFQAIERAPNLTPVSASPLLERPRLRGLASNRLLIILDGERLNNARSDPTSGVSPSVIDVTQLEAAEVLGGAGSSLYGSDALSGVINLITKSPVPAGDHGQILSIRLDADLRSNGLFRRGAATLNWSVPRVALRVSGALFRAGNYHSGNRAISADEVVRLGEFATALGNTAGNSVARTYAVWSLPAGALIPNGQAHGFNDQMDLWFLASAKQSFRYRQLNSQHKDLGFSFIAPPFDQRTQFNSFRRLDKYGLRYETSEVRSWLPSVRAGFYRQKYSFPDATLTSAINAGSSWNFIPNPQAPQSPLEILTGSLSTFTNANFSENKSSITTWAWDTQATFAPFAGTLITTGVGYFRDSSADEFSRNDFAPNTSQPINRISGRASNPDTVYRNLGWFNLLEYEPVSWLRLTAGLRVDNWKTEARVTRGFPLGSEAAILDASWAQLLERPGSINTEGANELQNLLNGTSGIRTRRTVVTGNAGIVLRLRGGINPYFRWGTSYREPGITERYLLRDFGERTFSVLVIPNSALRPERGQSFDVGLKIQRSRWAASLGYFQNNLKDFIGNAFADPLFVPADASRGLNPISPFFPFHGVLYVQRTNIARARIKGFEAAAEMSLPLGRNHGVMTPFGTLGWLKGSNLTPDADTIALINQFYNRTDTPVRLEGSIEDAPLSGITPLRTIGGVRYDSAGRRWFGEYEIRYQARILRADPLDLSATISTQYGTLASLSPFTRHALRAGYRYNKEDYRLSLNLGLENLTNRLYFENFQTAPAPGRSIVFGLTLDLFNLLRR
ncbi:MAG TPA: TonB-dependent receptor [Pyrinomonadaceae bacterium]